MAKHLPKYLPGKPAVIVQNMPGASSMVAANYLYTVAKPDGLTILGTHRGIAFMQLTKVDGVKYDVNKYSYIGSVAPDSIVLCVRSDLPYKSFVELREASKKKPVFFGGGGPGSLLTQMTHLSREYLALNVEIVQYRGSSEIMLAIQQKEVDGFWQAYNIARVDVERGVLRPLLRAPVSLKGIEQLPVNEDLTTDPIGKAIFGMLGRTGEMARLYLAPPGVPVNVMGILRDAFDKALKDPELQADADKARLDFRYLPAEDCVKLMNFIFQQPPKVVEIFSKYVAY